MNYPKVLIFGQTFNDFSGGGITLTNLFKEWPKEKVAVLSYPFMIHNSSTDVCQNYYQIGHEELKWKFPFSLIKQKFPSGKIEIRGNDRIPVLKETKSVRHGISSNILTPALRWSGMVHSVSSIRLSLRLKEWLLKFKPDVIYIQISNRESINFAIQLINYLKIPSVIHMMDDWPSTISSRGPFKRYWYKKIDLDFRLLLDKTNVHLSISDAMSAEYLSRYGKTFFAFHNPVDPASFSFQTSLKIPDEKQFRILYLGRVGTANEKSILRFASFISSFKLKDLNVTFDIYTKDLNSRYIKELNDLDSVYIKGSINHDEIQLLMKSYDLLLLPLDFTGSGLRFSRLSIPTKASEYMMSGKPILVFAPSQTAISRFFYENECGHCLVSDDFEAMSAAMKILVEDVAYRNRLGEKAMKLASLRFNGEVMRRSFRDILHSLPVDLKNH